MTGSIQVQNVRFIQWDAAIETGREIHVLGDFNIDFLKWNNSNLSPNSQTAKLKPLTNQLFNRIIPYDFSQLVTSEKRHK